MQSVSAFLLSDVFFSDSSSTFIVFSLPFVSDAFYDNPAVLPIPAEPATELWAPAVYYVPPALSTTPPNAVGAGLEFSEAIDIVLFSAPTAIFFLYLPGFPCISS